MAMAVRRRRDPQQPIARVSTRLLSQSGANDGATGPSELPESNGTNYAQPGDGSGQARPRLQRRRRRHRRQLEELEELEGNNPSLWMRLLGYGTSIVAVIGLTDQMQNPQSASKTRIIRIFLAALLINAATVLAAQNPSWNRTGEVMFYICLLMLVAALVYATPACTEFLKKIKGADLFI